MKAILIFSALIFSTNAFSENQYLDANGYGWDASYYGGTAGGSYSCGSLSCVGHQYGTVSYSHPSDTKPSDNEDYFYLDDPIVSGNETIYTGVFRQFIAGQDFNTKQDFDYTVSYTSFGLENLRFYTNGYTYLESSSGSFSGSAEAGKSFSIGMLGLLSDSIFADDAFFSFELTFNPAPPSEVPLPASMFLLAPALLGFMGLRRKLS